LKEGSLEREVIQGRSFRYGYLLRLHPSRGPPPSTATLIKG